jgi:hypothetical protein
MTAASENGVAAPSEQQTDIHAEQKQRKGLFAVLRACLDSALQHWFILGLGLFIGLGAAVPQARRFGSTTLTSVSP